MAQSTCLDTLRAPGHRFSPALGLGLAHILSSTPQCTQRVPSRESFVSQAQHIEGPRDDYVSFSNRY